MQIHNDHETSNKPCPNKTKPEMNIGG
jgi:hypothetical protein